MKSAPNTSALDAYIREKLKVPETNLPSVDWSEVEVLLRHEKKSIPIEVNKKTLVYGGGGIGILILIVIVFKIVGYYASLPPEPEVVPESTQSSFNAIDTAHTSPPPTIPQRDTLKIDSSALVKILPKIDSLSVTKSTKKSDSGLVATPLMPDSAWIRKIHEKKDKKRKQLGKDTDSIKTYVPPPQVIDTPSPPPVEKIKVPTTIIDTATAPKNAAPPKNNSKKKKSKPASPPATGEPQSAPPAEIKPDSLK